jgi:LPXTG-site transpeptidase (sortase) family protein
MTSPEVGRRRHRRRSSPLQRLGKVAGGGHGQRRAAILGGAVAIMIVGALIATAGATPIEQLVAGSPSPSSSFRPQPTATLPGLPSQPIVVVPSPQPAGIVAKRITIPRLGIDLRIIEGDGTDAPMNKAAHYPGTGWPGGGTNIYIYAHAQTGMFLALWDARVGDEIDLALVDGTNRAYTVTAVKPKVPWNALELLKPTPSEQLTLQTSTSYTPTAPRFVVVAEPAP